MHVPWNSGIEHMIKERVESQAATMTLRSTPNPSKFICANDRGHDLLGKFDRLLNNVEELQIKDRQRDEQEKKREEHDSETARSIQDLSNEVATLKGLSEGFMAIRQQAHQADALSDAMMYDKFGRTDTRIYRCLYGLEPRLVLEISM